MKLYVFSLATAATLGLVSCGGGSELESEWMEYQTAYQEAKEESDESGSRKDKNKTNELLKARNDFADSLEGRTITESCFTDREIYYTEYVDSIWSDCGEYDGGNFILEAEAKNVPYYSVSCTSEDDGDGFEYDLS